MSLQKPRSVYAESKQQYTAAGRRVPWSGIYKWGKAGQGVCNTDWQANTLLRELYRSVVTKREFSNTAALSVFKCVFVFVPILIYGHESWVMTKRAISSATDRSGFSRKVYGVTLRDKVLSCEIRNNFSVEPLFRTKRSQLRWFVHAYGMAQERVASRVLLTTPKVKRFRVRPRSRRCDYISDLAWSRLGEEPAELSEIAENRYLETLQGCCPRGPSREEKRSPLFLENEWTYFVRQS